MYISVVKLSVNDIERAVDFYVKNLGWEKTMDADMGEGSRWVTVAPSGAQTAFTLSKEDKAVATSPDAGPGVILECDDVFKAQQQLSKTGVEFVTDPSNEPWGGWAMFKDSEGNLIGLHSPVPAGVGAN